ncbi:integral membrane protein GPR137C isoform X2 [Equus asinus]|uniref:integral membrane protein GPR137C isoform X2 n=1 Tax=Equus asinus TaxID=9793 RepID=UPI0038F7CA06
MRVSVPGPAAGREPPTPGGGGGAAGPGSVQLALSILHALLYAALFAFAYLQLWRLLLYRERRLSHQSLCLFLCLLWAALRTTLFSAAFSLSGSLPLLRPPAHLRFFPHWLLYCFPSCLQFSTLCLLNLYLAELITYAKLQKCHQQMSTSNQSIKFKSCMDSEFSRNTTERHVQFLPIKGMSLCQTVVVGSVVILLYSSRACYNLVVVTVSQDTLESPFNYGWDNLSDKAQIEDISGDEYIVFGMVLFLWEHVPAWSVVLFFRAQRLNQNLAPAGMINTHSYSSRAYFFDNPRRYDSDDDLPRLGSSREGSLSNSQGLGWYGTMTGCGGNSYAISPHLNGPMTDTAPLLFTCNNLDMNNHQSIYGTPQN